MYYIPYCNNLAEIIGCKPPLGKMMITDPALALRCYFGPCSPSQYRLIGPGAWDGARQAIMEISERNVAHMRKKVLPKGYRKTIVISLIGLLCLCVILLHMASSIADVGALL